MGSVRLGNEMSKKAATQIGTPAGNKNADREHGRRIEQRSGSL
jgi:hypothetical protein